MNEINVADLHIGKYYSAPLFIDKNFMILTPDIILTKELITKLKMWGYRRVFTRGKVSDSPGYMKQDLVDNIEAMASGETITTELDEKAHERREESLNYFMKTLKFFSKIFRMYTQTGELDKNLITDKIKQMREMLELDKETFFHLPDVKSDNYLIVDSVKSSFLALALSDLLKLPVYRQIEIGIASILHDVGMFRIPSKLYLNDRKLTTEEFALIRNHVNIGTKSVREAGFSKEIVQAVQEHHESFDGSGYPFKSAGGTISLYGRMLSVIGAYTAATSKRLFRNKKGTHFGIVDILRQTNKLYDPSIAKVFILMLSIYPLGTFVELMDGKKGVVTKTSMQDPKHPVVKVMLEENNTPISIMKEIHTLKDGCHIRRALNEEEIVELKNIFKFNNVLQGNTDLFQG